MEVNLCRILAREAPRPLPLRELTRELILLLREVIMLLRVLIMLLRVLLTLLRVLIKLP